MGATFSCLLSLCMGLFSLCVLSFILSVFLSLFMFYVLACFEFACLPACLPSFSLSFSFDQFILSLSLSSLFVYCCFVLSCIPSSSLLFISLCCFLSCIYLNLCCFSMFVLSSDLSSWFYPFFLSSVFLVVLHFVLSLSTSRFSPLFLKTSSLPQLVLPRPEFAESITPIHEVKRKVASFRDISFS